MKKPTIQEVSEYAEEKDHPVDSEEFVLYYESVGWVVGKSRKPMKSWKAAVALWAKNSKKTEPKFGKKLSIETRAKRVDMFPAPMGIGYDEWERRIQMAEKRLQH